MVNNKPHPVRNGIIATVVGGLILSVIPQSRGFLVEALSWVWAGVTWVGVALISYYSMPGWAFLIVGLFALVGVAGLCVILWPQNKPAYQNYTEGMLFGAKWRWSWTGNEISDLWCFYPNCDAQLISREGYGKTDFICERCPSDEPYRHSRSYGRVVATVEGGGWSYAVGAAEREIRRRIRTGEYVPSNG